MNSKERSALARRSATERATSTTGKVASIAGGYAAGRFARNQKLFGQPGALVAGAAGVLLAVRGKRSKSMKLAADFLIGVGAYGAGKMGEDHATAAGNTGTLFGGE